MTESALTRLLLLESSKLGVTLFRNNVGVLRDIHGTYVRYGLSVGSPDLVGWLPVTIAPEHVGRTLAVFVGVEVKQPKGQPSPAQVAFLAALQRAGAKCGIARAVEDLATICSGFDFQQRTDTESDLSR